MADHPSMPMTVEYGDHGSDLQPIHLLPLTPDGLPILPSPVGPDTVMRYARALESDQAVSAIFGRMGKWGLPSREELEDLEGFRDEWIASNGLQDCGINAYFGANMLHRRIAWGQIRNLDDPRAMQFLRDDEPRNVGGPVTSRAVSARLDEILWLANYVIELCDYWPLYADDWRNSGIDNRYYAGEAYFNGFINKCYFPKYGYYNRRMLIPCKKVLERFALGDIVALGCKGVWDTTQADKSSILSKVILEGLK